MIVRHINQKLVMIRSLRITVRPLMSVKYLGKYPETCIACGYSLRGHSMPIQCPECGAQYDSHTLLIMPKPKDSFIIRISSTFGTVGSVSLITWLAFPGRTVITGMITLVAIVLGLLFLAYEWWRINSFKGPFLAVLANRLIYRRVDELETVKQMEWSEVVSRFRDSKDVSVIANEVASLLGVAMPECDIKEIAANLAARFSQA